EFFWREHLHPDDRERAIEKFLNIAKSKQDGVIEYRFLAADGRVVWIRDSLSIVSENGRNVLRGIMIDVTANKEAEQTTQQSLKLVN
ncbi:MAG TPA: PAS domain-containing protein, partial [Flavobacterium sp.]|nr:PAS domain-containing protein [Flavobacterium sp.]